jgi:hypothetical protein
VSLARPTTQKEVIDDDVTIVPEREKGVSPYLFPPVK